MDEATRLRAASCHPRQPADLLSPEVIATRLHLVRDWTPEGAAIKRTFTFKDFHETMAFVNAVAWIAHREDHHPDLEVGDRRCLVRYTTHSTGGLTENDFICALRIDALVNAPSP